MGVSRNAEATSDTHRLHLWIWLMRSMILSVVACGVWAYWLPSLNIPEDLFDAILEVRDPEAIEVLDLLLFDRYWLSIHWSPRFLAWVTWSCWFQTLKVAAFLWVAFWVVEVEVVLEDLIVLEDEVFLLDLNYSLPRAEGTEDAPWAEDSWRESGEWMTLESLSEDSKVTWFLCWSKSLQTRSLKSIWS